LEPSAEVQLSLVIACFNEAQVLPLLDTRLRKCLDEMGVTWEVIFIDDGSCDKTLEKLIAMHQAEPRFKVIALSRNFGHQAALCAGLHSAVGQAVGILDADLQDPPELFGQALAKLHEGFDVVYAVRRKRKESLSKRAAYALFYRLLRAAAEVIIPLDTGDFCLMRRSVVDAMKSMPERNIFLRGWRAWSGFRQIGLEYERNARAAGETKYPLSKLLRLATDGLFAFSIVPLRMVTLLGLAGVLFSSVLTLFVLTWWLFGFRFMGHVAAELPGWTTVVCLLLFLNGLQFLILGCLGEYIGRTYTEVKQRPRWVVRESFGLAARSPADTEK
jgi:glycosyltransferase involved in cell wall biosynthesis